jgi:predicted nucleotidyltransferase component of viral defense system
VEPADQRDHYRGQPIVIPRRELDDLRSEWSLDIGVIEKDYVLGWLLAGIAAHTELAATWIFKGGTCLRKCYYETFRFSEDLDFHRRRRRPRGAA